MKARDMLRWVAEMNIEKFHDCWDEYVSLAEAAIFEYAFRLGARLAIEIQGDTKEE